MLAIDSVIFKLQSEKFLPASNYQYYSWEQQFSFVYKIEFENNVFYLKNLKSRFDHTKAQLSEKLTEEYDALIKIHKVFKNYSNFNIPAPVYYSSEDLILVTKEIKGISIQDIANRYTRRFNPQGENVEENFTNIAVFLKILHDSESLPYTIHDLAELIKYIKKRLLGNEFRESENDQIENYLGNTCEYLKSNIAQYSKNPVHHDLNPTNILSYKEQINVLDFGDFRIDHYYQDIIYFRLMLEGQLGSRIKYRQSIKQSLIIAFYEGYGFNFEKLSNDNLYQLYLLKNLSIFLKTLSIRNKEKFIFTLSFNCLRNIMNRMISYKDYYMIKKQILSIIEADIPQ